MQSPKGGSHSGHTWWLFYLMPIEPKKLLGISEQRLLNSLINQRSKFMPIEPKNDDS